MIRFACWLSILTVAAGCGGSGDEPIAVSGTVTYVDGSEINFESGTVTFEPTPSGKSASGAVQDDGSFEMTTTSAGDGVHPGDYKVVLQLWSSYRDHKLAVPDKYGDVSTTPLEATVSADSSHFDFKVEK